MNREENLRNSDLDKMLKEAEVTTEPKKIRYFTAHHGTYYCADDICAFLEEQGVIADSGVASWNWLKHLSINLAQKMRKKEALMGIDCFMMMGLCETYVHWITVERMLRKIVKKEWSDAVKKLNSEIDYEEGVLNAEFFANHFIEVEVNKSGFNVMKPYEQVKELITVEKAEAFLKATIKAHNLDVDEIMNKIRAEQWTPFRLNYERINYMAEIILGNKWVNGSHITVDHSGITDGLHRIIALMKANTSLTFDIRYVIQQK